jgi:hypothetical protein
MSSTGLRVMTRTSFMVIAITALLVLRSNKVQAEAQQAQPAEQTVAAAENQTTSSPSLSGASTILKVPPTPPQSARDSLQTIPTLGIQPPVNKVATPLPALPISSGGMLNPAPVPATNPPAGAVASATAGHLSGSTVQMQVHALEQLFTSPALRRTYERAATAFPGFCQNWERLLHEREVNNLGHLNWVEQRGLETATYTGYGRVESCECKASKEGLPIGKIQYEEINYLLAGKTIDQAEHTVPKSTGTVNTLEIFSWDKNQWFY